jgi:hypothetical protein
MVDLLMPTAVGKGEWTQSCKLIGTGEKCARNPSPTGD